MGRKRQQGTLDQLDLFEARQAGVHHVRDARFQRDATGEGGTGSGAREEPQASTVWRQQRALTETLMEEIASSANLNQAYSQVKANKGAAGVDGMTVADLRASINENRDRLIATLIAARLDSSDQPKTVRGVEIPKRHAVRVPSA